MTLEVEQSPVLLAEEVERLIGELTLTEKCTMLSGADIWRVPGCPRLGIPSWRTSDGPVGVRGREMTLPGLVIPGPSAIAATWDTTLVEQLGDALGEEAVDRDVDLLLAPTVNLHRSPRGGRHFECLSEDPELTARIAVAYINGVQSRGVGACIKHFIANDQEHERMTIEARVDERTLREVYLRPFEAGVHEASVRSVMASYNFVNGHHATAQPELLQGVLRDEWGFDGVVVSDWVATKETVAPALHGLTWRCPDRDETGVRASSRPRWPRGTCRSRSWTTRCVVSCTSWPGGADSRVRTPTPLSAPSTAPSTAPSRGGPRLRAWCCCATTGSCRLLPARRSR
ncbi:MAG: glycoside hydrolase family 3 protein [Mycobacteriales bacterium]